MNLFSLSLTIKSLKGASEYCKVTIWVNHSSLKINRTSRTIISSFFTYPPILFPILFNISQITPKILEFVRFICCDLFFAVLCLFEDLRMLLIPLIFNSLKMCYTFLPLPYIHFKVNENISKRVLSCFTLLFFQ